VCACFVRWISLRRADSLSRGVLPTVVCHPVWSRKLKNEAALARVGLLARGEGVSCIENWESEDENLEFLCKTHILWYVTNKEMRKELNVHNPNKRIVDYWSKWTLRLKWPKPMKMEKARNDWQKFLLHVQKQYRCWCNDEIWTAMCCRILHLPAEHCRSLSPCSAAWSCRMVTGLLWKATAKSISASLDLRSKQSADCAVNTQVIYCWCIITCVVVRQFINLLLTKQLKGVEITFFLHVSVCLFLFHFLLIDWTGKEMKINKQQAFFITTLLIFCRWPQMLQHLHAHITHWNLPCNWSKS
jgi:hypothetical protein